MVVIWFLGLQEGMRLVSREPTENLKELSEIKQQQQLF